MFYTNLRKFQDDFVNYSVSFSSFLASKGFRQNGIDDMIQRLLDGSFSSSDRMYFEEFFK